MKNEVLFELVKKWQSKQSDVQTCDGSESSKLSNATKKGFEKGLNQCADDLMKLIELLS